MFCYFICNIQRPYDAWRYVFLTSAGIYAFGAVFYWIYGTGERQWWSYRDDLRRRPVTSFPVHDGDNVDDVKTEDRSSPPPPSKFQSLLQDHLTTGRELVPPKFTDIDSLVPRTPADFSNTVLNRTRTAADRETPSGEKQSRRRQSF